MMRSVLSSIISIALGLFVVGCSGAKVVEDKPLTEKLSQFKHVVIEGVASDKKAEALTADLITMMHKRVTKAKLFETVGEGSDQMAKADLIIKGDIYDSTLPEGGFKISSYGAPKMILHIRYTFMSKKDKKVLGQIQTTSDSSGGSSIGGFSTNTDTGKSFGRSADELVKYLKNHM